MFKECLLEFGQACFVFTSAIIKHEN